MDQYLHQGAVQVPDQVQHLFLGRCQRSCDTAANPDAAASYRHATAQANLDAGAGCNTDLDADRNLDADRYL